MNLMHVQKRLAQKVDRKGLASQPCLLPQQEGWIDSGGLVVYNDTIVLLGDSERRKGVKAR